MTKVTGQTTLDFLKPRLFEPLGIENPTWDRSPEGNSLGGYGLKLCTEDIAKFGQVYLQKGKWNGRQLVPQEWIEQATSRQVPNDQEGHAKMGSDWTQGYGFQFWRCTHNAYRGDGANGQFCVVIPDKDVVIAITAQTGNMQGELNVVWDKLYPAFGDQALPEDAAGQEKLKEVDREARSSSGEEVTDYFCNHRVLTRKAMTKIDADNRSPQRRARDEQLAAEPQLPPLGVAEDAVPMAMESKLRARRRPVALEGIVEDGIVRQIDNTVKLPNHSRVIVVAETA